MRYSASTEIRENEIDMNRPSQKNCQPDQQIFVSSRDSSLLTLQLGLALGVFSLSLALLIGNIGFEGDDWWQFSWPFWFPFPQSIWEYAKDSSRPIEGVYTVLAFDAFGLNRVPYTLISLFLAAGSCLLLASCLKRAFPARSTLAIIAGFMAFFLTPVSNLVYMIHTDNSRISMLFFWLCVFAFQRWALSGASWRGLLLPVILYLFGAFTYENTTFLIFCVPLLVWPVYVRHPKSLPTKPFPVRLFSGILGGFAIFVMARFVVFSGGAVKQNSLFPPLGLIWSYLTNLGFYIICPVTDVPHDVVSWLWAAPIALVFAAFVLYSSKSDAIAQGCGEGRRWEQSVLYVIILGLSFVIFGTLPYLLAGYHSDFGFTSQSRIYSAASYGVAILGAALFTASRSWRIRAPMMVVAVALIFVMASFLAGLRTEWRQAEVERSKICRSLIEQVPDVAPRTTFLFLGLQSYIYSHGIARAVVFQGVDGLGEWIKMLYGSKDVYAYFIYPKTEVVDDDKGRRASASPSGVNARGSAVRGPIPLDTILIVERLGNRMRLLDKLSEKDGVAAIDWQDVSEIRSNTRLIVPAPHVTTGFKSICGR
ncbi:MAG: glucosyltransferase domain-containing protein [Deltaproteobacteria bacterium]|nr:glucosyltransferase domain-containing protein [Deltaproteobacteria bacterium]